MSITVSLLLSHLNQSELFSLSRLTDHIQITYDVV